MPLTLQSLSHPIRMDASGVARVGATRVTLETIVHRFMTGDTPEEIADAYSLDLATVYSTISYYLQHRAEVDVYLRAGEAQESDIAKMIQERSNPVALRSKLLARVPL